MKPMIDPPNFKNAPFWPKNWRKPCRQWLRFASRVLNSVRPILCCRKSLCLKYWEQSVWGAAPIIIMGGFSVGIVTWFQIKDILSTYGAEGNLPSMLALAIVVQTGPLLTGLISAARLGAGIAAELATMNYAEELDALESLGINATEVLVTPRIIAVTLALPALTVIIDMSAISGAMLAESLCGEITPRVYCERSLDLLSLQSSIPATLKTSVFGFMASFTASYIGLNCPRETEAVGRAALKGVAYAISSVFAADFLLVPVIQWTTSIISQIR